MNSYSSTSDTTNARPEKPARWLPVLVILGVLGGGFVLFMLFIVLPAVLFLGDEESSDTWPAQPVRTHPEVELPVVDPEEAARAPDFFDDLGDDER